MATEAQIEANRRNAQHSTGPRTPEGKRISSLNARKHGLSAQGHAIAKEDPQPETLKPDTCHPTPTPTSFYACRHGFHALDYVIAGEDPNDFEILARAFRDQFEPQNVYELSLVRQLIDAEWRLRRVARLESSLLTARLETVRRRADEDLDDYPDDPEEAEVCLLGRSLISDAFENDPLSKLSRCEARLHRQYARALALLESHRKSAQDTAA